MPENLMCPGQRVQSPKYRENFDRIFKKTGRRTDRIKRPATQDDVFLMANGAKQAWVASAEVDIFKKKGWRLLK